MSRPPTTLATEMARRPSPRPVMRRPGDVLLRLAVMPRIGRQRGETAEEATARAQQQPWWERVRCKATRPTLAGGYWIWAGRP